MKFLLVIVGVVVLLGIAWVIMSRWDSSRDKRDSGSGNDSGDSGHSGESGGDGGD